MNRFYIFVDDERNFNPIVLKNDIILIVCRSYASTINVLRYCKDHERKAWVDLNYDLGEEKTGYDICKFIVENQIPILGYHLYTMNPVGRQNMEQFLSLTMDMPLSERGLAVYPREDVGKAASNS